MRTARMRRLTPRLLILCVAGLICAAISPWRLPALPAFAANADQALSFTAPPPETPDPLGLDEEALAWVESTLAKLSLRDRAAQVVVPWISGASASENGAEDYFKSAEEIIAQVATPPPAPIPHPITDPSNDRIRTF